MKAPFLHEAHVQPRQVVSKLKGRLDFPLGPSTSSKRSFPFQVISFTFEPCRHTYPSPCLRASLTKSQQVSSCERSQDASVFLAPADTAARISHNEWSPSSSCKTFSTRNPATGEPLLDFSYATKEDVDRAVKAAREAFQTTWGNNLHATERAACNFCFVWWISVRADACLSDI